MRRIALFSDIHGNLPALDAVLGDIERTGIEERYCLGDLVGYGPKPSAVVDRVRAAGIPTVLGNYDEGIGQRRGECGCYYATEQARLNGEASYAFTDRAIGDDQRAWLAQLPARLWLEVGGLRVLLTHGSPRKINEYLLPDRTDAQLLRLAEEAGADVVCVGHVHLPYHRTIRAAGGGAVHYVSAGSVGKPKDGDPRACWVEMRFAEDPEVAAPAGDAEAGAPAQAARAAERLALEVVVHRVAYDVDAVAERMRAEGLPEALVEGLARGE